MLPCRVSLQIIFIDCAASNQTSIGWQKKFIGKIALLLHCRVQFRLWLKIFFTGNCCDSNCKHNHFTAEFIHRWARFTFRNSIQKLISSFFHTRRWRCAELFLQLFFIAFFKYLRSSSFPFASLQSHTQHPTERGSDMFFSKKTVQKSKKKKTWNVNFLVLYHTKKEGKKFPFALLRNVYQTSWFIMLW